MSNLVKMVSPTGEIVEITPKNVADMKQHHGFKLFKEGEELRQAQQQELAHAPRKIKDRDQEEKERIAKGFPKDEASVGDKIKRKRGRPRKEKTEETYDVEDNPVEVLDADFDSLEAEEDNRGKYGEEGGEVLE